MKKEVKKKSAKKNNSSRTRRKPENTELYDLGLEPPKIYREGQRLKADTQRRMNDSQSQRRNSKSQSSNPTKAQKREQENKKRKKRNKFRRIFVWIMAVVVFLGVGVVLSLTVFFHINTISVKGETQYSVDEILAQCTIDKGENLFMSDAGKAKKNIEQKLPYIYTADIKRKLPGTIEITVKQAVPRYSIKCKDKTYILLDDNFKVLELGSQTAQGISISKASVKSSVPGNMIEFKNEAVGDCLKQLAQVVKDNDFSEITSIYSKSVADNCVIYDGRITFKLGNCDSLEEKIYKGLTACEQLNESNPNAKGIMNISSGKEIYFTEE